MGEWDFNLWDALIILVAGYMAWMILVRLMANRHNRLVERVRGQLAQQKKASQAKQGGEEAKAEKK